ncbi:MAG TPA: hypothetical protein VHC22_13420 [Pirellulales bacterium]|nr:hypothetical protein [Pirellulales bacterium]
MNEDVEQVAEEQDDISVIPYPSLGIDLDAPLEEQAIFVRLLAHHWPGKVIGFSTMTMRATEMTIEQLKLHTDDLIVAESPQAKADAVARSGVSAVVSHDFSVVSQLPVDRARLWLVT